MGELVIEREDTVCTVTLNRPDRRGALSRALLVEIARVAESLAGDSSVRVVVFSGNGPDFSVGVDLKDPELAGALQAPLGERRRQLQAGPRMVQAVLSMPQTTIVAMHGHCLGGGGCLALACDLRVVAGDTRFGMPEVLRGMNMSWRTVPLMVATFGATRTKELLLTGRHVEAHEALVWGLASRVVVGSGPEARREAVEWARELAISVPPLAAAMVKETVNAVSNAHAAMVHMDTDQYLLAQQTDDFRESVAAFLEKRAPKFEGR